MSYLYLKNSDQTKYSLVLKNLKAQISLENNQYPKTIVKASHVLSLHKFDKSTSNNNNNNNCNKNKNENKKENKDKPDKVLSLSFAQLEGICYCCGKKNHKFPNCCHKDKPKSEWNVNKLKLEKMSNVQTTAPNKDKETKESDSEKELNQLFNNMQIVTNGWVGVHANLALFNQFL